MNTTRLKIYIAIAVAVMIICFVYVQTAGTNTAGSITFNGQNADQLIPPAPQLASGDMPLPERIEDLSFGSSTLRLKNGQLVRTDVLGIEQAVQDGYPVSLYNSRIALVDGKGEVIKHLYSQKLSSQYFLLLKESDDGKYVFVTEMPDGLGGYILYRIRNNFERVNLATGEIERLYGGPEPSWYRAYYDISGDGTKIAYSDYEKAADQASPVGGAVIVYDRLAKKELARLPIDVANGFTIAGNTTFSPDGNKIAYFMNYNLPDNEEFELIVYDLNTKKSKILIDTRTSADSDFPWMGVKWLSNTKIEVPLASAGSKVFEI